MNTHHLSTITWFASNRLTARLSMSLLLTAAPVLSSAAETSVAPQTLTEQATETSPHALRPAQLSAIRAVGRNVLAAKRGASEDTADAEQLERLRLTVDALIATELDPNNRAPITLQGQESGEQRMSRESVAARRESTRADARAVASQLRQRGGVLVSRVRNEADAASADAPLAGQRAQIFERLAHKLNTALADGTPDRIARLTELRDQIDRKNNRLVDVPLPSTPTLQAMPSDSVTPIRMVSAAEAHPLSMPVRATPRKPQVK